MPAPIAPTPKRILFVNTLYPPHGMAGAETTLRFLASALAARGHDCSVVTLTPAAEASQGEVDGLTVHYLPLANVYWPHGGPRPAWKRPLFQAIDAYNPVMKRRLLRVIRAVRPDVIHAHNLQGFSVSAWGAARQAGVPLVQTLHDYYTACPRSAMWRPDRGNCATQCADCRAFAIPRRAASRLPETVTCVSHLVLNRIAATGMFADARARVIRGNNPGDAPVAAAPERRAPGGPLRLGFIGRLDRLKGLENLLDAIARLPTGSVHLSVAGHGAEAYEESLRARGAPRTDVTFLGHVKPATFFPAIDLLVIPSVWQDPFPRVYHEALAYGVPSLVSPLGGLPEVVQDRRTGFVAGSADVAGFQVALAGLVDGGWEPGSMRAACLQAASAYTPETIVAQYEAVLLAAAARREPPDWAGERWQRPSAARAPAGQVQPSPQQQVARS